MRLTILVKMIFILNQGLVFYNYCIRNRVIHFRVDNISMGWCKKDVTSLLTHWSYVFLTLTHRYVMVCIYGRWSQWRQRYLEELLWRNNIVIIAVCINRSLDYKVQVKPMLKYMVNEDFLAWLLIGWWLCCHPIKCQVWKSVLADMDFNLDFFL